jgi:hypothetical protein
VLAVAEGKRQQRHHTLRDAANPGRTGRPN